jgi:carbonic anhydrase
MRGRDPDFFRRLSEHHSARFLWIGCSDSRVPANEIVDLLPGEMFVHRNVANQVIHADLNCMSVLQFAVDLLNVEHVIACGHYGCRGVLAALRGDGPGLSSDWLRHLQDVRTRHSGCMPAGDGERAAELLCELNVIEQVTNVARTGIVREAWARGQHLQLHGWIYGLHDGLIKDLGMTGASADDLEQARDDAVSRLGAGS